MAAWVPAPHPQLPAHCCMRSLTVAPARAPYSPTCPSRSVGRHRYPVAPRALHLHVPRSRPGARQPHPHVRAAARWRAPPLLHDLRQALRLHWGPTGWVGGRVGVGLGAMLVWEGSWAPPLRKLPTGCRPAGWASGTVWLLCARGLAAAASLLSCQSSHRWHASHAQEL